MGLMDPASLRYGQVGPAGKRCQAQQAKRLASREQILCSPYLPVTLLQKDRFSGMC